MKRCQVCRRRLKEGTKLPGGITVGPVCLRKLIGHLKRAREEAPQPEVDPRQLQLNLET